MAQFGSALALGARGRGFESHYSDWVGVLPLTSRLSGKADDLATFSQTLTLFAIKATTIVFMQTS